ncbi:MAG TPA: insulinase family protein [Gemmatimonadaceae bacterium]|nr:insulinase family protein [Gemmatimonadaceae bacterium]
MKRLLLSFVILCIPVSLPGQAAATAQASLIPFDPAVIVGTLPNGLRYYIRENRKPELRAELRLVVNAGSVLEEENQRGLAHVVEHMAFRGTHRFARNELTFYLESIGMRFGPDINAFTSFDETVYLLTIPTDTPSIVTKGFQILSEWAQNVEFDSAQIERERPVVIEEWRLGQGAENRMQNRWFPVLFSGSRYASRLPIGEKAVLESFSAATLRNFYDTWYRPDLMAIVAVGDFDGKQIETLIRRYLGGMPRSRNPTPRTVFPVPPHDSTLVSITTDKEATRSVVRLVYKQPKRSSTTVASYRQNRVEQLFGVILNDRLNEITQKASPPFINAFAGQGELVRSAESFSLTAIVGNNGITRGLEALLTEGERVRRFGFLQAELDRAKKDLLRGLEQAFTERDNTSSEVYAGAYASAFLRGEAWASIEWNLRTTKEMLPTITLEEVNRLAGEWMGDKNRAIATTSPDMPGVVSPTRAELLATLERIRGAGITPYAENRLAARLVEKAPTGGSLVSERVIREIGVTEWRLSNGVRVLLKPTDFKADQIVFSAYSPGGASLLSDSAFIPAAGADIIPSVSGVGKFSMVELQKFLAGTKATVSTSISDLGEGMFGDASPRDLETMLELVYLYFTEPRLDTTAAVAFLERYKGVIANRNASPEVAFSDTLQLTMAQHALRAQPITSAVVDRISITKSFDFFKDRFADAGDFTFVFVGNLNPDSVKPQIVKWLGSLPSTGRKETWRDTGIRPPTGVVERVVRKGVEQKARTALIFTGPFEYTRANRYHLSALAELLTIRLREALRENLGGTYGVSVGASASREPIPAYSFSIGFGSSPERLEALTAAALVQIDSVKRFGVSDDYVTKVRQAGLRGRETALKQNQYWLSQISSFDQVGWPLAQIPDADKLIMSLTSADLQRAAARYLRTDNYVRVSLYPDRQAAVPSAPAAPKE